MFEIKSFLASKYAILAIESREETRLLNHVCSQTYSAESGARKPYQVLVHDATNKVRRVTWVPATADEPAHPEFTVVGEKVPFTSAVDDVANSTAGYTLLVCFDAHIALAQPHNPRTLLNAAPLLERNSSTVILVRANWKDLQPEIKDKTQIIRMPLPKGSDLDVSLDEAISIAGVEVDAKMRDRLRRAVTGLPEQKIVNVLCRSFVVCGHKWDPVHVSDAKMEEIRSDKLMRMYNPLPIGSVGGLRPLTEFVADEMVEFYGDPELGTNRLLVVGPPGTGKTTLCMVIASYLNLPLIAVKLGDLKGSLVGETNEKTTRALDQIDAVENAVVWFDEFDKQTADADSSGKTGSTTGQQVGEIATWMESRQPKGVVVVATANYYDRIPAELASRFSHIFFVDLPSHEERKEIASVHLKKRNVEPTADLINLIADVTPEYSGREIEQVILSAIRRSRRAMDEDSIRAAAFDCKPLSVTRPADIARIREVCAGFRRANTVDGPSTAAGSPSKGRAKRTLQEA